MRLERGSTRDQGNRFRDFNSIKVRLELGIGNEILGINVNFNSIKVRLEQEEPFLLLALHVAFQVHKGAIRTPQGDIRTEGKELFQFHKGAIRTFLPLGISHDACDFNSIKVRLERDGGPKRLSYS